MAAWCCLHTFAKNAHGQRPDEQGNQLFRPKVPNIPTGSRPIRLQRRGRRAADRSALGAEGSRPTCAVQPDAGPRHGRSRSLLAGRDALGVHEVGLEREAEDDVRDRGAVGEDRGHHLRCGLTGAVAVIQVEAGDEQEGGFVEAGEASIEEGVRDHRPQALQHVVFRCAVFVRTEVRFGVEGLHHGVADSHGQAEVGHVDDVQIVADHPAVLRHQRIQRHVVEHAITGLRLHGPVLGGELVPKQDGPVLPLHRRFDDEVDARGGEVARGAGAQDARALRIDVRTLHEDHRIGAGTGREQLVAVVVERGAVGLQEAERREETQVLRSEAQVEEEAGLELDGGADLDECGVEARRDSHEQEVVAQERVRGIDQAALVAEAHLIFQTDRVEAQHQQVVQDQAVSGRQRRRGGGDGEVLRALGVGALWGCEARPLGQRCGRRCGGRATGRGAGSGLRVQR